MARKAASTPQKQPAANVARSAPSGPWPSNGGAGAGWVSVELLSFSTSLLLGGRRGLGRRCWLEGQRGRVDAVALAGRARPVAEDVAEVPAAAAAQDLGAAHEHAVVRAQLDRAGHGRLVEARPAGAGVELGVRAEQLVAAARTAVGTVLLVMEQLAGPGHLGMTVAQ